MVVVGAGLVPVDGGELGTGLGVPQSDQVPAVAASREVLPHLRPVRLAQLLHVVGDNSLHAGRGNTTVTAEPQQAVPVSTVSPDSVLCKL